MNFYELFPQYSDKLKSLLKQELSSLPVKKLVYSTGSVENTEVTLIKLFVSLDRYFETNKELIGIDVFKIYIDIDNDELVKLYNYIPREIPPNSLNLYYNKHLEFRFEFTYIYSIHLELKCPQESSPTTNHLTFPLDIQREINNYLPQNTNYYFDNFSDNPGKIIVTGKGLVEKPFFLLSPAIDDNSYILMIDVYSFNRASHWRTNTWFNFAVFFETNEYYFFHVFKGNYTACFEHFVNNGSGINWAEDLIIKSLRKMGQEMIKLENLSREIASK